MVEPVNDNILNLVNELYNNLDAKDKIINEQALEIARLNNEIQLRIKSIEKLENDIIEYQRKIQTIKRNCKRDKAKLRNRIDKAKEYINELLNEEIEITDEDSIDYGTKCQRAYFSDAELGKVLEILEAKNE